MAIERSRLITVWRAKPAGNETEQILLTAPFPGLLPQPLFLLREDALALRDDLTKALEG